MLIRCYWHRRTGSQGSVVWLFIEQYVVCTTPMRIGFRSSLRSTFIVIVVMTDTIAINNALAALEQITC